MANYDYTLRINGNADAVFDEILKKYSSAQKRVDSDAIEIKFNCDDESITELINEIQKLNPEIGTDVKLNFDQAEMRKQLTRLNGYISKSMDASSISKELRDELKDGLDLTNIKNLDFKKFLRDKIGYGKSVTKNVAQDYVMDLYKNIGKLDFSRKDISYTQILETISKYRELIAYSEKATDLYSNLKFPDFSDELENFLRESSVYIEKNKDNLKISLIDSYKDEMKKFKEIVKGLGIKTDMFPSIEVDVVADIDPAEFAKDIQRRIDGQYVEIDVKPNIDDAESFSKELSDKLKNTKVSVDIDASIASVSSNSASDTKDSNKSPKLLYHWGGFNSENAGKTKAENFASMISSFVAGSKDKSTNAPWGSFGSGMYVVSNPASFSDIDFSGLTEKDLLKQFMAIDVSKLNLYETKTTERAQELYDFLTRYQQFVISLASGYDFGGTFNPDDFSIESLYEDLRKVFNNINMEFEEFESYVEEMLDLAAIAGIKDDGTMSPKATLKVGQDNFSTRLLKRLGYDGVNNEGTEFDNLMHGSVIFDPPADAVVIKWKELGDAIAYANEQREKSNHINIIEQDTSATLPEKRDSNVVHRNTSESDSDSVGVNISPDFSPKEFVDEIKKQLSGLSVSIDINAVLGGIFTESSSNYANVIGKWNEADKIMKSAGKPDHAKERLAERGAFLNTDTGYISNSYVSDKIDTFRASLQQEIYKTIDQDVDAIIHSHPQGNLAAFSPEDFENLKSWRKANKNINKTLLKAYSQVGLFDISNISDEILDEIISEYRSEMERIDSLDLKEKLKYKPENGDVYDATNIMYQNALNEILRNKNLDGAFSITSIDDFIDQNKFKGSSGIDIPVNSEKIRNDVEDAINSATGTPDVRIDDDEISSRIENAINNAFKKPNTNDADSDDKVRIENDPDNLNLGNFIDEIKRKIAESGEFIEIDVKPFVNVQEFISDIENSLAGHKIDIGIDFNSAKNASAKSDFIEIMKMWNEADKWMKASGSDVRERAMYANLSTGEASNAFSVDQIGSVNGALLNRIRDSFGEGFFDASIHSHPERYAAFSDADMRRLSSEIDRGITKSIIKTFDEIAVLDFGNISKEDQKRFIKEYTDVATDYSSNYFKTKESADIYGSGAYNYIDLLKNQYNMDEYDQERLFAKKIAPMLNKAVDLSGVYIGENSKKNISQILASKLFDTIKNDKNISVKESNQVLKSLFKDILISRQYNDSDVKGLTDNFSIKYSDGLFKELFNDSFQKNLQYKMFDVVSKLGLSPDVFKVYSYDEFDNEYGVSGRSNNIFADPDVDIDASRIRQNIENELNADPIKIPVIPDSSNFVSSLQDDISSAQSNVKIPVKPDTTDFIEELRTAISSSNAIDVKVKLGSLDPAESDNLVDKLVQLKKYGEQFSLDFSSGRYGNLELTDGYNLQEYVATLRSLRDEDLIRIGFDIEQLNSFRDTFREYDEITSEYHKISNIGGDYSDVENDIGYTLTRLQDIYNLISKINLGNTFSFESGGVNELSKLDDKLFETTDKIDTKTAAFEREGQIVSGVIQGEINDLSSLDGWIDMLSRDISKLADAITNLPKIDIDINKSSNSDIPVGFLAELDYLKKILNDFDFDNLKVVSDAINSLKISKSAVENLQGFSNAFLTFKSNLNNFSSGSKEVLSFINDLLSKTEELNKLSNILTELKTKNVSSVSDLDSKINEGQTSSNNNLDQSANDAEEATNAYKRLSSEINRYYSILDKQLTGNKISSKDWVFKQNRFEDISGLIQEIKDLDAASVELTDKQKRLKEVIENTQAAFKDSYISDISRQIQKLEEAPDSALYEDRLDSIRKQLAQIESFSLDEFFTGDSAKIRNEIESIIDVLRKSKQYKLADNVRVEKLDSRIVKWLNDNSAAAKQFGKELQEIRDRLSSGLIPEGELENLESKFNNITKRAGEMGKLGRSFGEGLKSRFESLGQYLLTFASFYDVVDVLRRGFDIIREIDTAQVELVKVADASTTRLNQSFETSIDTAEDLKSSISDAIAATADWSRSGYGIEAAEELAEASILYKNVGDGISIDEANASLISTLRGFKLEASDAMSIVDKFNEVANNMPIDSAGIGEALQRSASSFNAANTDLSESIALIVGSNSVLQDPTRVGNMWKTVSARIRGAKLELQEAGEDTEGMVESTSQLRGLIEGMTGFDIMVDDSTFKNMKDIIVGIGKEWKNLSDVEQAGLLEKLAGKTQANALAAALENYELIEEAYQIAENSEGSALREQEAWKKSLDARIQGFITALEKLAVTAVDSGFLGGFIDAGTTLINVFTELIDLTGILTPLLGTIGGVLATKNGFGKQIVVYNAPFYKAA